MGVFFKFDQFSEDLGKKIHNLDLDVLKVMLTNVVPVAANAVKADITEIGAGNGYAAGGTALAGQDYEQVAGVSKLVANDVVFVAGGGSIGPFRWAILYNSTAAGGPLIGYWDRGASITLQDGDNSTIDTDQVNGILTVG